MAIETKKGSKEMAEKNQAAVSYSSTYHLVTVAMFAAVIAVASWISIPLPFTPVPVNLGTLAVMVTGALLGKKYGVISVITYILLGAVGLPVFAGFTGGLGHIVGPTGGYIVGYAVSAFLTGLLIEVFCKEKLTWQGVAAAGFIGTASCYALGTIWFMMLTNTGIAGAMTMCVIPFLPGDAVKLICAVLVTLSLRPRLPLERP